MKYRYLILTAAATLAGSIGAQATTPNHPRAVVKEGECLSVNLKGDMNSERCKITIKSNKNGKNTMLALPSRNFNISSIGSTLNFFNQNFTINALPAIYYLRDADSKSKTTLRELEEKGGDALFCYESILTDICHN